jgi:hypothetical protein
MERDESLEAITDIKRIMEKSSRFISLSGLSGVSAGVCALIGAWIAWPFAYGTREQFIDVPAGMSLAFVESYYNVFNLWLFWIAIGTFVAAFTSAFFFTWLRSKKEGFPIWGKTARRLVINVSIPMVTGAIFLGMLVHYAAVEFVVPGCLIFYGLGLVNASKYTLEEIRYLGYSEILLGIISLFFIGYGLFIWAFGFGVLHIVYGIYMWWKYERSEDNQSGMIKK